MTWRIQNGNFDVQGATAYDAANWEFYAGNNGGSYYLPSGFTFNSASLRGRQPLCKHRVSAGCVTSYPSSGSNMFVFINNTAFHAAPNSCNGTPEYWNSNGQGNILQPFAQISQLVDFGNSPSIASIQFKAARTEWVTYYGEYNEHQIHVYISPTMSYDSAGSGGVWNHIPDYGSSIYRYYTSSLSNTENIDNVVVSLTASINTSEITGSNYLIFRVVAVNPQYDVDGSNIIGTPIYIDNVTYTQQISAPTNLAATHNNITSYNDVCWSQIVEATSYRVYYSLSSGITTASNYITSVSNTASVNIVANDVNAYYRVAALDSVNNLTSSLSTEITYSYSVIPIHHFHILGSTNPKGWSREQGSYGVHPANIKSDHIKKGHFWSGLYSGVYTTGGGSGGGSSNPNGGLGGIGSNEQNVPGSDGSARSVKLRPTGVIKSKFKIGGRSIDLRRKRIPNALNFDDRYKDRFGNPTYTHISGSD